MSSRSLGTLTLDLVARSGGFVHGMDSAERSSAKWRKQVEKDLQTVARVSGAAMGAAAAATAGLIVQQVRAASEISKLAQVSGAGTTEFQRYAAAADVVGINQEKLSDQLKDFNEKAGEFQQSGGGGMKDFFEQIAPQIGITADAFRDLSGPQALQLYYDSLEKAGLSQQQMSFYLESMASDTTALIPLLRDGGAGFKLLGDEAERAGAIMSEETITAADRLSAATLVANNAMAGFRNTIGEQLLPVLGDLAIELSTVAEEGAVAEDVATALTGTIKGLTAAAVGAFATFQVLGRGMGGLAASTREAMEDMSWWEKLNPMKVMTKTIGSAVRDENESAKVAIDDLDQTLLRYGEIINNIFDAGSGGDDATGESTIDRIAKLREEMRKLGSDVAGGGAGSVSDEAKKAQEAIANEITALERAAETWGMTAGEVKLFTLAQEGATESQLKAAGVALRTVQSLNDQQKAMENYKSLMNDLRTPNELINDQLRDRIQILNDASVSSQEYAEAIERISRATVSDAPEFGGLDASVGGVSSEMLRVDGAQDELDEWREEQLELQLEFLEQKLINEEAYAERVYEINKEFSDKASGIDKARALAQQQINQTMLANASNIFGSMAGIVGTFAGEQNGLYQAMFLASKAFSIAQSIVAIQTGIANAAALPFPANLPAMATVAASTASIISTIQGATLTGMAHNGIDSVPREGTWLLDGGERVLNPNQNRDLTTFLSKEGQGASTMNTTNAPQINFNNEITVESQSGANPEEARQYGQQLNDSMRAAALDTMAREVRPGGLLWRAMNGRR